MNLQDFGDASDFALLICDLQNDFLHPDGVYAKSGIAAAHVSAVTPRVRRVAEAVRRAGGVVVGTMFTLVPGRDGEPLIAEHLKKMRPFLGKGHFAPGSWGQAMLEELGRFDGTVEKIAYSAFYQTRLEWLLRRLGVKRLAIAGIVTQGGVASTLRDAAVRDYPIILLEDGCASFEIPTHQAAVTSLSGTATVMSCDDLVDKLRGTPAK
ncbi:cysteine hydrolase family protein [Peristeroidobacter soli]|uniref:cysteine hydrolase family protein n=1 Tax=Peristeroidobacter soli TaxID=2497877 RepID=UPI00101CAA6E|nr:cysteine hydrolase [Peristeroidobacter soli]